MAKTNRDSVTKPETAPTKAEQKGVVLRGADWLLSRLPWFKYRYESWSRTRRIVVGYLMWLIVLPVIPLTIMAIWFVRDPEGFKKSPLMPVLAIITVAWLGGGLGYVNSQTPYETTDGQVTKAAQSKVEKQATSNPTNGKAFENCTAAFNDGVYDIPRSNPSYEQRLDRDGDGIACER